MPYSLTNKTTKLFLTFGILGAFIMFIGDMLLYFDPAHAEMTSESVVVIMRKLDIYRVMAGGAVGPFATLLYCFGYLGLASLIRTEYPRIRAIIFLTFTAGAIYGGAAYHSMFPPMAFAVAEGGTGVIPALSEYIDFLGLITFGLWTTGSLLFLHAVLSGRTFCRKWTVLFAPFPMALAIFVLIYLPPPLLIIIAGGWYSLVMLVFFVACLLEARKRG